MSYGFIVDPGILEIHCHSCGLVFEDPRHFQEHIDECKRDITPERRQELEERKKELCSLDGILRRLEQKELNRIVEREKSGR